MNNDFDPQTETDDIYSHPQLEDREIINEDVPAEDKDEDDLPMALIVEDDPICQLYVLNEMKNLKFRCRTATTVTDAKNCYLELANEEISIDVVFLDILLKDKSTGIEFLKMIRENKWMEKTLIIVMSGVDDMSIVKECYKYNIQNFLQKPITKQNFAQEKVKIIKYIEENKCPIPGYNKEKQIGAGASAIVYLIRHKKTKEYYAMKEVTLSGERRIEQPDEVKYLKNLKAPTIIGLKESRLIDNKLYMILEYAEYGTLNMRINQKRKENGSFTTDEILDWMTEVFIGIYFIHQKGVMHRDIKSDNLFLSKHDVIKIGDLGVARSATNAQTICGTAFYMAPEMFNYQTYNYTIDIWAAGVVLYELVMLKKPFEGTNSDEVKSKIMSGSYAVLPENTDPRLKRLLNITLNQVEKRATAKDVLCLSFIRERVYKLFQTKFRDDALLKKISELEVFPECERLPFEDADEQKTRDYYKCFKIASILNLKMPKTSFKPSFFNFEISDVIEEYYINHPDKDLQITSKNIEELIKVGLLGIITAKGKKKYYKVQIKEKDNIDNSLNVPLDKQQLSHDLNDPVGVSKDILQKVFELWNDLKGIFENENENEQQKSEFLSSQKLFDFFLSIKKLSYFRMSTYNSNQKLAIILNVYQTMYFHYMIKLLLYEEFNHKFDIIKNIISLFCNYKSTIDVTYKIDNYVLSISEMKNIVIRRNKAAPNSYFRHAYSSDPRIDFIDLSLTPYLDMMIKLHCICLDPPYIYDSDGLSIIEPEITCFNEDKLNEDITTHVIKFIKGNVTIDDNCVNIPILFKLYCKDFSGNEEDLLRLLFNYYYSELTQKKKSKLTIIKINSGNITVNYYRNLLKSL